MSGQPPSKKWVDYSDSDSSEGPQRKQSQMSSCKSDHKSRPGKQTPTKIKYSPSRQETNKELDKLDKLDNLKVDEVWVEVFSENLDYLEKEIHQLKAKAKKGGNIVQVFCTKQSTLYELKVYINIAYQWIQRGYDSEDYLKITVSERNFDKITRIRSPKHHDQVKKTVSGEEDKKRYVDKKSSKNENLEKEKPHNEQKIQKKEESRGEKNLDKVMKKEEKMDSDHQEEPPKKTESVIKEEPKLQEESAPKKKQDKSAQVKKEKEVKKPKKQAISKNIKSSNPFDGMLDL